MSRGAGHQPFHTLMTDGRHPSHFPATLPTLLRSEPWKQSKRMVWVLRWNMKQKQGLVSAGRVFLAAPTVRLVGLSMKQLGLRLAWETFPIGLHWRQPQKLSWACSNSGACLDPRGRL
jgi:hypothetical protein